MKAGTIGFERVGLSATLQTCCWEVLDMNRGRNTNYSMVFFRTSRKTPEEYFDWATITSIQVFVHQSSCQPMLWTRQLPHHKACHKNNRSIKLHYFQMSYSKVLMKFLSRTVYYTCPSSVLPNFCHSVRLLLRTFVGERRVISFSSWRYRVLRTSSMKPNLNKSLNLGYPHRTCIA
jgi:hypothetical protein